MAVSVICLFLAVPWVVLQCAIAVSPGHTHLRFENPTFSVHACILYLRPKETTQPCMDPEGDWWSGAPPPLALKNKLSSACQRNAITMAFRWQADVSVFFKGRSGALCLLGVVFLRNTGKGRGALSTWCSLSEEYGVTDPLSILLKETRGHEGPEALT